MAFTREINDSRGVREIPSLHSRIKNAADALFIYADRLEGDDKSKRDKERKKERISQL